MCEIFSKLQQNDIKFIANFKQVYHIALLFLLLTLNK